MSDPLPINASIVAVFGALVAVMRKLDELKATSRNVPLALSSLRTMCSATHDLLEVENDALAIATFSWPVGTQDHYQQRLKSHVEEVGKTTENMKQELEKFERFRAGSRRCNLHNTFRFMFVESTLNMYERYLSRDTESLKSTCDSILL